MSYSSSFWIQFGEDLVHSLSWNFNINFSTPSSLDKSRSKLGQNRAKYRSATANHDLGALIRGLILVIPTSIPVDCGYSKHKDSESKSKNMQKHPRPQFWTRNCGNMWKPIHSFGYFLGLAWLSCSFPKSLDVGFSSRPLPGQRADLKAWRQLKQSIVSLVAVLLVLCGNARAKMGITGYIAKGSLGI